jgi:hypothetical protein
MFSFQPVPEGPDPGIFLGQMVFGQYRRFAQANDIGHVFGAAPASAFLMAADDEGLELGPLAHVKRADALGACSLWPDRDSMSILAVFQVDGHLPTGLNGVGMKTTPRRWAISAISSTERRRRFHCWPT